MYLVWFTVSFNKAGLLFNTGILDTGAILVHPEVYREQL